MPRVETLLGALSAFLFVVFMAVVPTVIPVSMPERPAVATSTLAEVTSVSLPALTLPSFEATTTEAATLPATTTTPVIAVAPKKTLEVKTAPAPVRATQEVVTPAPAPKPAAPVSTDAELNAAASTVRAALVNIICYVPAGSGLHSISGSGVIIDPKGIILTNAHVAQYFLLADRGVDCTIRSGSPAVPRYEAELLFIPSAWVSANAAIITQSEPAGTGEQDFALLGITASASRADLPAAFPYIPGAVAASAVGTPLVIASYGAQFLQADQIRSSLYPTIVFGSVKQLYTFGTNTPDVIALGGSAAAQEGSSGGGVATAAGELVATITTSTVTGSTDTRELNAITLPYIRAAYAGSTGEALDILLARPITESVSLFAPQKAALEALITANL